MDGIAALNKIIDEAKKKRKRWAIFKVDLAKAYDSVSWSFLFEMMTGLNFCSKWISWILECVPMVTATVLIKSSPSGEFKLGGGLRQGDPLSPFLYMIIAEGLSLLVN